MVREVELHNYQDEWIAAHGAGALGLLINHAAENPAEWAAIFRTVHCRRCDNENGENAWKKSKHSVQLELSGAHWDFLEARVANVEGLELEEKGPVMRAVADLDKAVRCAIDWAVTQEDEGEDVSHLLTSHTALELEMHDYHEEFLAEKTAAFGLADKAAPLRCLLNNAAANPEQWDAMFRTVHCHRCDNDDGENAWKKSKKPVLLPLLPAHVDFLEARVANVEGVELEDKGPVHRAVVDVGKAARCAIDWAITQEEAGESVAAIFGWAPEDAADALEIPPLSACLNTFDYELAAERVLLSTGKANGWAYFSSGADDEETLRNNMNAFHHIWMRPKVLRNVAEIDMSCDVLGVRSPFPLYLSAVAMQKLGHEDGELAWIRACKTQGLTYMVPNMSSYSADECFAECNLLDQPFFLQLYVNPDREIAKEQILKAEAAGCRALFITCDTPVLGRRDRDRRGKVGAATSSAGSGAIGAGSPKDASLNWNDLPWFRELTTMKIFLKGVGTGEDAVLAVKAGVDGIVCSNHGGRQLNTARSGIEVLAEVTEALEAEFSPEELADFDVLMDGGIRRGTDIFKALALGARAVGIGKPAAFAMSAYGQPGIEQMIGQLEEE